MRPYAAQMARRSRRVAWAHQLRAQLGKAPARQTLIERMFGRKRGPRSQM